MKCSYEGTYDQGLKPQISFLGHYSERERFSLLATVCKSLRIMRVRLSLVAYYRICKRSLVLTFPFAELICISSWSFVYFDSMF